MNNNNNKINLKEFYDFYYKITAFYYYHYFDYNCVSLSSSIVFHNVYNNHFYNYKIIFTNYNIH